MKPSSSSQNKNSMQKLLDEYSQSHQNRTNKIIHYIAVPVIFWTFTALLWLVKLPQPVYNLGIVVSLLAIIYYASKDVIVALQMTSVICLSLFLTYWLELNGFPILEMAIILFVIAWILQFVGHKIEGKAPSFFKDLQFLMIGPAWIINSIFRK